MRVSTFTETYLPTINGATYTINLWKQRWNEGRGRMTVTYPGSKGYTPGEYEYPVKSVPFPFYEGMNVGLPLPSGLTGFFRVLANGDYYWEGGRFQRLASRSRGSDAGRIPSRLKSYLGNGYTEPMRDRLSTENIRRRFSFEKLKRSDNRFRLPREVRDTDVVHVHGPFAMGMAGASLALSSDLPLVANYHTPTDEYVDYMTSRDRVADTLRDLNNWWERRYLEQADAVVTPSRSAKHALGEKGLDESEIHVIRNGIDTRFFRPVDTSELIEELGVERPVVGYCGRHGYEKRLRDLVDAAEHLPADVVVVGDGPAREDLVERADEAGADVVFPGFLERSRLPEFYSMLDAFVFPSDAETEGLVALEATACGAPVVCADAGGLRDTVRDGVNGYRYPAGDVEALVETVERVLEERDELRDNCLDMRDSIDVENTLEKLETLYSGVR